MKNNFFYILAIGVLIFIAGAGLGLLFFYFFKEESVFIINKFKILQGFFGIREYQEGMSYWYIFVVILFGNLVSTICYLVLGYLRILIPISFITGFFIVIFLMSGIIRHSMALPVEVIILSSAESFYRILALSTGEHIQKNKFKNKAVPVTSFIVIFLIFLASVFYEMHQIFG